MLLINGEINSKLAKEGVKGYNVPGIETDRMERGLGRLRIGGENRREGEDWGRRRNWGEGKVVIAEKAIGV